MKPVYLLAAVSCYGLVCYKIYDSPVTNNNFCSFIVHLFENHRYSELHFLLFDNATFHSIPDFVRQIIGLNNYNTTRTAPNRIG